MDNLAIMVTAKCNLKCYHCFRPNGGTSQFIDAAKIIRLSTILPEHGLKRVRFTGGEPFLHSNLSAMVEAFASQGIFSSVVTNGTIPDAKQLESIASAGLNALWFSVHSVDPEKYRDLTGGMGLLDRLTKVIKKSVSLDIETNIFFPVSTANSDEVDKVFKWADELGVNAVKVLKITPLGRASLACGFEHIHEKDWRKFWALTDVSTYQMNIKVQGVQQSTCMDIGKKSCTVLPLLHWNVDVIGEIYPCCILNGRIKFSIGNIEELFADGVGLAQKRFRQRAKAILGACDDDRLPCLSQEESSGAWLHCPLL